MVVYFIALGFPRSHPHRSSNLEQSSTFFEVLHANFPGRIFKIKSLLKPKGIREAFPSRKANVITQNYPLTAEGLRKKLSLTDGGEDYILGVSSRTKHYLIAEVRLK